MKILVTGGAGFIGGNIVIELVKKGYEVKVIDNFATGRKENLKGYYDKINFIEGDIRDLELLKKEFKDIDCVLHQAAIPSVPRSVNNPLMSNEVSVNGTLNVLLAARDSNVDRVIYASSSSIYGDSPEFPKKEAFKPNPKSPYAIGKLAGEHYCKAFYELYGLKTISLRYFNVFGPRQDPTSQYAAVIPLFIRAIVDNKQPTIFGDGLQSRDFSYVQNNIEANILAMKAKKGFGEIINIACGERINLIQLVDKINKILNKNIKPRFDKERKGDVKHSLADISKAKEKIGYKVVTALDEGLKKTIEWCK